MKRLIALAVGIVLGIGGLYFAANQPPLSTFDRLLALAVAADKIADAEEAWAPTDKVEFDNLVASILYQIAEEGFVGSPRYPAVVTALEYGAYRSRIAGSYNPDQDIVALNMRYFTDPSWRNNSYLDTLVHELVHSQGFMNESQTETIATEVVAALANLDYPGFRQSLAEGMRGNALASAFFIAYYGGTFQTGSLQTSALSDSSICLTCGDKLKTNAAQMAQWQKVREQVYTPVELRRTDARLRFWLQYEGGLVYKSVIDTYVVRPTASLFAGACSDGSLLTEKYARENRREGAESVSSLVGPFRVDDIAYFLREAGWTC